jgi:transcriptional accessory protein Tex/SPT6
VNNVAKVGEIVKVRVYNVDKEKGRIGLEKIVEVPVSPESPNNSNVVTSVWE